MSAPAGPPATMPTTMPAITPAPRRDEGSVLPLVLVMMVISAMIIIPLMNYTVSVLKANTVVADNTRDREAAEGAIRVALTDPDGLFKNCTGGTRTLTPPTRIVDAVDATTTCRLSSELGPLDLSSDGTTQLMATPMGVTATQLGAAATMPAGLAGTLSSSPVLPSTADERWWTSTSLLTEGRTWLPDLPVRPKSQRSSTAPFGMPAAFGCTVFLPGYYPDALTVSSGRVYFASGVYYFEKNVTFTGNADVIVGMGLNTWTGTECADDMQVRANLLTKPSSLNIQGGGATFIFGADGRLVIDNASTTASTGLSVRFNQRYAESYNGGRVSIMSVNGDDTSTAEHRVDDVVAVPRSVVVGATGATTPIGTSGAEYLPSNATYTSEARAPTMGAVTIAKYVTPTNLPPGNGKGAVFVTWNEIVGQDMGGSLMAEYQVEYTSSGLTRQVNVCTPTVVGVGPNNTRQFGCFVQGLKTGSSNLEFFVRARNASNIWSPYASSGRFTIPSSSTPLVKAPDAPNAATITVTPYLDAAGIAWTAPNNNGAPITSYTVTAERVYREVTVPASVDVDGNPVPAQYADQVAPAGTCTSTATTTAAAAPTCVVANLVPLVDTPTEINTGYRFSVTATSTAGTSVAAVVAPTALSFAGGPIPTPPVVTAPVVEPWIPTPIVDIKVTKNIATTVLIPGYVSVPMGRVSIANPNSKDVRVSGGILTGTIAVTDPRPSSPDPLPIGYKNDIVLQRTVVLTSKAGHNTVTAFVQINENGDFTVNSWVVN